MLLLHHRSESGKVMNMSGLEKFGPNKAVYNGIAVALIYYFASAYPGFCGEEGSVAENNVPDIHDEERPSPVVPISATGSSNILFKSGFEDGVYLRQPIPDDGGIWWQKIGGSDIDGFTWPITIAGNEGEFQLIVDHDKDIHEYIENRIETVPGSDGRPTRALHQIIRKKQAEDTQDPFIVYTNNTEVEDLYIKYSIKLPSNIASLLADDGWMALTEFKTTEDFRLAFYIYQENGELYWYVHGDNVVLDNHEYEEFWYVENKYVPVPVNDWFEMEIFWHRSSHDDGKVSWTVNKETIASYSGRNRIEDPINAIMVFTNYASNPIHQWIDNIEIRDGFPDF